MFNFSFSFSCLYRPFISILSCVKVLEPEKLVTSIFKSHKRFKTPSTRSRVFSKTETFFSEYGYRPHVTGVFGHRKRRFLNTLSRVEIFENGDSSYSCGRAKTEVFKYDDVMPRFKARSSAHTIRKRYVWTEIFLNTEKKISVFENTQLSVDSQITIQKRYEWT